MMQGRRKIASEDILYPRKKSCVSTSATNGSIANNNAHRGYHSYPPAACVAETALSNIAILKNTFSHLIYEDLVSCSNICPLWKKVADPLTCFYRITLDDQSKKEAEISGGCEFTLEVEEVLELTRIPQNSRMDFHLLMRKLRSNKEKHLMSIELCLSPINGKPYRQLLTEFGDRVHSIDCESSRYPFKLTDFLSDMQYFPNLEVLKLNGARIDEFYNYDDLPPPPILPNLRRIFMGKTLQKLQVKCWPQILRMAPNVKELLEFPVKSILVFPKSVKIQTIKSIMYMGPFRDFLSLRDLRQFDHSLRTLADLGVQLTSVPIPNFYYILPRKRWDKSKPHINDIQENFRRILNASKDTLRVITVPPAKGLDYHLPVNFEMPEVRTLRFEDESTQPPDYFQTVGDWLVNEPDELNLEDCKEEHHYCPEGTNLKAIFPNLECLEVKFNLSQHHLYKFFPGDTFGPQILGTGMKSLKIKEASPECFEKLVKLFPHVTRFEMESSVEHFTAVFPTICREWPNLESLTVFFDPLISFHRDARNPYCRIDPVLTGIPEELCMKTNTCTQSQGDGLEDEIRELQAENVSLLKMKSLERLEFIIAGSNFNCVCGEKHVPNFMSAVSGDYAFRKLPQLSVLVRMTRGLTDFKELRNALEPVFNFIQLDNKYSSPERPRTEGWDFDD